MSILAETKASNQEHQLNKGQSLALYELIVKPHFWQKTNHGLAGSHDEDGEAGERP